MNKRLVSSVLSAALMLCTNSIVFSDTSDIENSLSEYTETDVIDFENANSNGDYISRENNAVFRIRSNTDGDSGVQVINEPGNETNKIGVIKNLYENKVNSTGDTEKASCVSAYMSINEADSNAAHRIGWRMKQVGNSKTEFHLESEASTSKPGFEFLAYTGVSDKGKLLNPNHYSDKNRIINELTAPNINIGDNKWHNFEAYFYSGGKASDNNRKVVELYCDGVLYARYERSFPHSLKQIEIYSTGTPNEEALYIDDISLSRIPDDFYMTAEYNAGLSCIDTAFSLYPDGSVADAANNITLNGQKLTASEVNGRKIRYTLNSPLENGRIYALAVPNTLTSEGKKISNSTVTIEVPPDQPGYIDIATDKTGNVFTSNDDLKFKVIIKNTDVKTQSFTGRAWITADDQTIVWNNDKSDNLSVLNVISNGVRSVDIKPVWQDNLHTYGRFRLNVELKPKDAESYKKVVKEFTVIFSNGFVNERVGIGSHYSNTRYQNGSLVDDTYSVGKMQNIERAIELQNLGGFGMARDAGFTYGLNRYGTVDALEPSEFSRKTYQCYSEQGTNIIQVIAGHFWSKTGWFRWNASEYNGIHMLPIAYTNTSGERDESELIDFKNRVKKFTEFNSRSHIYEIFNEWNLGAGADKYDLYETKGNTEILVQKDYKYTIDQYIDAVKAASEGIREADPQAKILGICSAKDNMEEFVEECLKNGIGQYIDAVSIHPYSVNVSPEIGHRDDGETTSVPLREKIKNIRALLDKYNLDLPIVITEIGWTNAPLTPITEEIQAEYSIRALGLADDLVEFTSFYEALEHGNNDLNEQHYGMLYPNDDSDKALGAKPVFWALSCFNSLTADKTRTDGIVEDKNDGSIYCTYENECERVIMYWNPDKDNQSILIPKSTDAERAYIRDMYGNIIKETADEKNGFYSVSAGTSPQYLIMDKSCDDDLYVTVKYLSADEIEMTKDMEECFIKNDTPSQIKLKTAYKNTGSNDKQISAILAAYDEDGKLTNVSLKNYMIKSGESFMPKDMPSVERKNKETVRGYIWDLKLLKPLSSNVNADES